MFKHRVHVSSNFTVVPAGCSWNTGQDVLLYLPCDWDMSHIAIGAVVPLHVSYTGTVTGNKVSLHLLFMNR